jgi:hypothetical protein
MIEELIARLVEATGLTPDKARFALSSALGLLQTHARPDKLAELYAAVPGTETLARQGQAQQPQSGGGLLGGMMKTLGGSGGAAIADALAMSRHLNAQGVSNGRLKKMLPVTEDFVQEKTGRNLLREVLLSTPAVGAYLSKYNV